MSRKAALVLCLMIGIILLIPSQTARANGDPVIRFSSVNRVGNPTPRKITDITEDMVVLASSSCMIWKIKFMDDG